VYISLWALIPAATLFGAVVYWWRDCVAVSRTWESNYLEVDRMMTDRQERYLTVLKRELANEFLSPELVHKAEREIADYIRRIEGDEVEHGMTDTEVAVEWSALVQQFPDMSDFDIVSLKHYVPYAAAKEWHQEADFYNAYLDISKFIILNYRKESGHVSDLHKPDLNYLYEVLKSE